MNEGLKIFGIVLVVAAVGVGGYLLYQHYNNNGSTEEAKKTRKLVYVK